MATYHYHFTATHEAFDALKALLPTRTTDRTLNLHNRAYEGKRYIAWELSKVDHTTKNDAIIRVLEALHPGLVHLVTDVNDKPFAEPFDVLLHSNYKLEPGLDPVVVWYERTIEEADSMERLLQDLKAGLHFVEILEGNNRFAKEYKYLLEAYRKVWLIVKNAVETEPLFAGYASALALAQIKALLAYVDNAEKTQHPSPYIIRDLNIVYSAVFARLHSIAFFGGYKVEPAGTEKYTLAELQALPTIEVGQFDNCKVKTGNIRVWLSRMTVQDGARYNNGVTVEVYRHNQWENIAQYEAI